MFTYQLPQPRRPFASALQATLIHASLIAGAVWTTAPVTTAVVRHHEVIDLSGIAPHRRPVCDCVMPAHPTTGLPVPLDLRRVPLVPPVTVPVGIPKVDPRAFILSDSSATSTAIGGDSMPTGGVLEEGMVDEVPTLVAPGLLRYPAVLQAAGIDGSVTLSFVIDAEGRVEADGVTVVASTDAGFVPAAEEAVLTSRFHPALKSHHPVRVRVRQVITFKH